MNATAEITLTTDQLNALRAFHRFLLDPTETVFVLSGYSGCGKSTLVSTMVDKIPGYLKSASLLNAEQCEYEVELTATTNKAAENLSQITGQDAGTIHAFLGLRVETDYKTNVSRLIPRNSDVKTGFILFIDEASYIDSQLLGFIFQRTKHCKIVFVGDPAQLTPVKSTGTPAFNVMFPGAALTSVVRQAEGNPIVDLSTKFRDTVNSGEFFKFKPDGHHVKYLERDAFNQAIATEFSRSDWSYSDSKILGWTNKCVIGYNQFVSTHVKGDPNFQVGDYAVCNSFFNQGKKSLKTEQLVQITGISPDLENLGVLGNNFSVNNDFVAFMPKTLESKNARIKQARAANEMHWVTQMEERWIDLRAVYACTINKAQGSTFDQVFIDLDDISRCNSGDQIARMLYVAVSRARNHVTLTGDLA
jgi:energy-coupling factor transporter ATP-binding protein EcfA2